MSNSKPVIPADKAAEFERIKRQKHMATLGYRLSRIQESVAVLKAGLSAADEDEVDHEHLDAAMNRMLDEIYAQAAALQDLPDSIAESLLVPDGGCRMTADEALVVAERMHVAAVAAIGGGGR